MDSFDLLLALMSEAEFLDSRVKQINYKSYDARKFENVLEPALIIEIFHLGSHVVTEGCGQQKTKKGKHNGNENQTSRACKNLLNTVQRLGNLPNFQ